MRSRLHLYTLGALLITAAGGAMAYAALSAPAPVAATSAESQQLKPLAPQVQAEFRIDPTAGCGIVHIELTAPSAGRDNNWTDYPIEYVEQLVLCRSKGYESEVVVKVWNNIDAGAKIEYDDVSSLDAGEEYTYSAKAVLRGTEGFSGYAYVTYGINPIQPDTPRLESDEGKAPVKIGFSCPEALCGSYWDPKPFPEGVAYSEIRLTRLNGTDETVLFTETDPRPGMAWEYEDVDAREGTNTYCVRTYTPYGHSDYAYASIFLGADYPGRVTNVTATDTGGTITVTWDAPTQGFNGGYLDPASLYYKIYRLDNDYGRDPVLLADDVRECRYVDRLNGLESEQMVYYRIYPCNDVEAPENTYNYGDSRTGILAGPPAPLPFAESFNSGSKWNKVTDNSWEEDFDYYAFSSHYVRNDVDVNTEEGSYTLTEGTGGAGNEDTGADAFYYVASGSYSSSTDPGYLTSGNLTLADAVNPVLSLYYIPVAGSCAELEVQMSTGEADEEGMPVFVAGGTLKFGMMPDGETTASPGAPEWHRIMMPLADFAGLERTKLRFAFRYTEPSAGRYPMIIDAISLDDYPGVADLKAEYDQDRIALSWNLPASAGGKEVSFDVMLDGEVIATTADSSYVYQDAEQGETYRFSVATRYADGTPAPVAEAEAVEVPLAYFTSGDFTYRVSGDGEVTLHSFDTAATDVVIPATVSHKDTEFKVVELYPSLFTGRRQLQSVAIEAEVEEIPASFLYGCVALSSLTLPEGIRTIGERAIFGCVALTEIALPESLEIIESRAFENCRGLTAVAFGHNLAEIGEGAFSGCSSLALVSFTTSEPPVVGADAFKGVDADCVGECPEASTEAYMAVDNLAPLHFPTAGIATAAAAVEVEYYLPDGTRTDTPPAGVPVVARYRMADGSVKTVKTIRR
ncbi:MAG: leucine-rich repeat protein [Muribaculaceae bacterium]|nr:leucine-rich repeat protein [Muribaculaceae bacterium]